jgi:hypothetical protein
MMPSLELSEIHSVVSKKMMILSWLDVTKNDVYVFVSGRGCGHLMATTTTTSKMMLIVSHLEERLRSTSVTSRASLFDLTIQFSLWVE